MKNPTIIDVIDILWDTRFHPTARRESDRRLKAIGFSNHQTRQIQAWAEKAAGEIIRHATGFILFHENGYCYGHDYPSVFNLKADPGRQPFIDSDYFRKEFRQKMMQSFLFEAQLVRFTMPKPAIDVA